MQPTALSPQQQQQQQQRINLVGQPAASTLYTVPKQAQEITHPQFLTTHRGNQQQTAALNKSSPQNIYVPSSTTPSSGSILSAQPPSSVPNCAPQAAAINFEDAKADLSTRETAPTTIISSTPAATTTTTTTAAAANGNCSSNNNNKKRPNTGGKSSSSKRRKPNSAASQAEQQKQLNDAQAYYDELVEKLKKDSKSLLGLIHQPVIPTSSLVVLPVYGSSCDAKFVWNSCQEELEWLSEKGFKYYRYPFSLKCPKPDTSLLMDGGDLNDSVTYSTHCNVNNGSQSNSLNNSMEVVEQIQQNENKFILQHLSVSIPDGPLLHSVSNKSTNSLSNVQQGIPDRPASPVCPSPTPQTFESSIKLLLNNTKLLYNQQIESLGDLPVGPMSAALHTAQSLGDLIPLEEETQNGSLMRAFQSSTGGKACCGPIAVPYNLERSTPPLSMFHLPNKEILDQLKITSLFAESANNQYLLESVDKEVQEFSSTQESVKQQQDVVMTPLSVEAPNIDVPSSFTEVQSVGSPTYAGPLLTASEAEQLHQALLQKEITPITISTTHSTEDSSGVSTVQVTINGISRSTTGGGPSTSNTDAHPSDERIDSRESSGGGGGASTDSSTLLHGSPIVDSETGEVLGMKQSSHRGVAVDDSVVGTNKEKLHLSFTLSPKSADNIQKMVKNITDMLGINFNSVNYQVTRTDLNTEITVNQNNPTIQPQKFQELEQQIRKQIAPLTWRMEQSQSKDVASCSEASIMDNFTTASSCVRDPTYQDSLSSISSIPSAIANSSPVSCTPIPSNLPTAGKHEEEHLSIPDLKLRSREENFYCRHCEVKIPPNLGIKKSLHDYRTESGLAFKSDPDSEEMSFCSPKCLNEFIQDLTEAGMSAHRFKDDPNFAHPSISTAGTAMNSSVSISSDSNQAPQSNPSVPPSHVIEYRQQFFNVPVVLQGPPPRYPKSSLAKRQMSSFTDQCLSSFSTSFNGKSSRKKNFGRFRKWRGHRWKPFNILSLHNTLNNHRKVKEETSMEEMRTLIRDYSGALKIRDGECVDTRVCSLCKIRGDVAEDGPGRLLCLDIDVFIHLNCALWCYEVYETMGGSLNSVSACSNKALSNMCSYCGLYGAGLPCYNPRCSVVYHVPCAQAAGCMFFTDRGMYCQLHQPKEHQMQLKSLSVNRRVYISRDENKQVAQVIHEDADGSHHLVRIGSLILYNLGQLLPHQIEGGNFHTIRYIYPVGFKTSRIYWSMRRPQKRCIYQCRIVEQIVYETELDQRASFDPSLPNAEEGQPGVAPLNDSNASSGQAIHRPEFIITVTGEEGLPDLEFRDTTCDAVWKQILNAIKELRMEYNLVKMFPQHLVGEELFGLTEPHILRAIESLPGVENLRDYAFKFGRLQLISEMPLAINPSGCARSEPKMRTYFRRARYAQTANMICGSASGIRHAANSGSTSSSGHHYLIPHLSWSGEQTLYGKQYISSRSQQYKKLKQESKNNVILGRSRIQGLGLFAARDLEKYTMVIEYIGQLIRCELGNRREKEYEAHNRGTYMFRLDDNYIVDATVTGGLARYINHSCQPNCVAEIVNFERESHIIIFANKRIERGEELTYDYKFDYEDTGNKLPCLCGAVSCRKWMN